MHGLLAALSRLVNRMTGGRAGESLCGRWCRLWGHDCLPCRIVGLVLRDPWHCLTQRVDELRQARKP